MFGKFISTIPKTLFKVPVYIPRINYYFCGTNQTALLEEVETKVFDILKTAAKCDQSKLSKKVSFEELGFDSLDSVELVVAME